MQKHRLTCTKCREQKVRCNRSLPRCSRCTARGTLCIYPERAKRMSQRQQMVSLPGQKFINQTAILASNIGSFEGLGLQQLPPPQPTPLTIQHIHAGPAIVNPPEATSSYITNLTTTIPTLCIASTESEIDVIGKLNEAIGQVRQIMNLDFQNSVMADEIRIPTDIANRWINNYFTFMAGDAMPTLINKRLIQLLPEIIHSPHITIDISMRILYYCILYHGYMANGEIVSGQELQCGKLCYVACLRALPAWTKRVQGSATDFVAALMLTRMALIMLDHKLAWKMHKLCNDLAQALNLHSLDGGDYSGITSSKWSDDDRRGFWCLIQTDLFFRLLMDKPPSLTANMWNVNLPWINAGYREQTQPYDNEQLVVFIASSRITMVLIRFFDLSDGSAAISADDLSHKTATLCTEIELILAESNLESLLYSQLLSTQAAWALMDCLLVGYTSIICMFRKIHALQIDVSYTITTVDTQIPTNPMALRACNRVLHIASYLLDLYPEADIITSLTGTYQIHIAIAGLYSKVHLHSAAGLYTEEALLLDRFLSKSVLICGGSSGLYALRQVFQSLQVSIKECRLYN